MGLKPLKISFRFLGGRIAEDWGKLIFFEGPTSAKIPLFGVIGQKRGLKKVKNTNLHADAKLSMTIRTFA